MSGPARDGEVLAVVGHNRSAKTLAAGPIYQRGLVAMTITATSDEIRALGPWVFRMAEPLIRQARALGYRGHFLGGSTMRPLQSQGPEFDGRLLPLPNVFERRLRPTLRRRLSAGRPRGLDAAAAYDAVRLFGAAVAAGNHSRASIREYLERVGRPGGLPAYAGGSGTIRFDADGDRITGRAAPLGVVRGSRPVPMAAAR